MREIPSTNGDPKQGSMSPRTAGKTWNRSTKGLPTEEMGRIGLDASPSQPGTVYAMVSTQKTGEEPSRKQDAKKNQRSMSIWEGCSRARITEKPGNTRTPSTTGPPTTARSVSIPTMRMSSGCAALLWATPRMEGQTSRRPHSPRPHPYRLSRHLDRSQ